MDLPLGVRHEQIHTIFAKGCTPRGAADITGIASSYGRPRG